MEHKLLAIYLNDHLAGATVGRELSRRTRASNASTKFGPFLAKLAGEIEEDRDSLIEVMRRFEIGQDPIKQVLALVGERAGRLKLNGRLREYSPLSRVVELEALSVGVYGKRACWRTITATADGDARLRGLDLEGLIERADRQLEELEDHRRQAVALL